MTKFKKKKKSAQKLGRPREKVQYSGFENPSYSGKIPTPGN